MIGFLSFWVYQEYLNNMYLRIYVNNVIQTAGWAFAVLVMIVVLGSVMIAVSRYRSVGKKIETRKLEAASIQVEDPTPTTTKLSTKPDIALHPMVAQLKAELARTPMAVENVPVPKVEETPEPAGNQSSAAATPTTAPTPSTVIVGMVPVQKKEAPAEQKPSTE